MLIVPNESSERVQEGIRALFKQGIKFVAIGAAGFVTWMSDFANYGKTQEVYPIPFGEGMHTDPLIPALIVIVIGLAIERAVSTLRKKKKRLS